ncbi:MAG: AEC family transporter [bacterium]
MLSSLSDPILPIFAILALGYCLNRLGLFDAVTAQSINKFVFYVATPALIFFIVSTTPLSEFAFGALGIYLFAQLCVYLGTFLIAHFKLGIEKREAILLGLTTALANHVFFVLPIAERIYGAVASKPIAGIVLVDVIVLFCGTVLIMDLMQTAHKSPVKIAGLLLRNPALIAAILGMAAWIAEPLMPHGLYTYAEFAGRAAAPASLFALGIILATNSIRPIGIAIWFVVGVKIFVHPLLVFAFTGIISASSSWSQLILLVAAGPCGVMPFVIALQYGVKTEVIAKAILISTVLSLVSLSILTA